jgi:hypothetical protein
MSVLAVAVTLPILVNEDSRTSCCDRRIVVEALWRAQNCPAVVPLGQQGTINSASRRDSDLKIGHHPFKRTH